MCRLLAYRLSTIPFSFLPHGKCIFHFLGWKKPPARCSLGAHRASPSMVQGKIASFSSLRAQVPGRSSKAHGQHEQKFQSKDQTPSKPQVLHLLLGSWVEKSCSCAGTGSEAVRGAVCTSTPAPNWGTDRLLATPHFQGAGEEVEGLRVPSGGISHMKAR